MKKGYCHHHIKNRSQGGRSDSENLLYIREDKEKMLHHIFGHLDFYGMILLILRTSRRMKFEKINPKIAKMYKFIT